MRKNLLSAALLVAGLFMGGHAYALEQNEAGVYQIGTTQDLVDFAALVNDETDGVDNSAACAVLTADIDLTDVTWTPIGNGARRYKGTFDGQYHSIKNMTLTPTVKEQGFFGVCENATIKCLNIDKSCTIRAIEAPTFAAFVGCCNGSGTLTLQECVNYADVQGAQQNNSAFVGCNYSSGALKVDIIYCANFGNISGGWENGVFSGWFASAGNVYGSVNYGSVKDHQDALTLGRGLELEKFINSYDLNAANKPDSTFVFPNYSDEVAKSGKVCYQLNCYEGLTGWYQTIGEDDLPVLDATHKQVYAKGENYCDGTPKGEYAYSNDPTYEVITDAHAFENGYCKNCGAIDLNYLKKDAEGYYLLGSPDDFDFFGALINAGYTTINARLTADIDYKDRTYTPIGTSTNFFCGTLDGQFYRIKNVSVVVPSKVRSALFAYIGNATFMNMIVDKSCYFEGSRKSSAYTGYIQGSGTLSFIRCGNEANVVSHKASNGNCAAFATTNNDNTFIEMQYCWNTGSISGGNENAIFCGWFNNAGHMVGCWNTGTISEYDINQDGTGKSLARGLDAYKMENCYDLNSENMREPHTVLPGYTDAMMANGALCYALNGTQEVIGWYQTLGEDATPVPDPSHKQVYVEGSVYCDMQPKEGATYTNTECQPVVDEHNYVDGICDHCGKTDPAAKVELDEEGYYHVASGAAMNIFAKMTQTDGTLKCKLDADIDMTGINYTAIGTVGPVFKGEIDGQMHRIKNLVIDNPDVNYQGFVGKAGGGFLLHNLIIDKSCSITGHDYVGGLVAASEGGGDVRIENCGNEANTSGTLNVAGIFGVNMLSAAHIIIKNVYNTGYVLAGSSNGTVSGWLGNGPELINVWDMGGVKGCDEGKPLYRVADAAKCTNCYSVDLSQAGFTNIPAEDVASGALCYLLNDQVSGGESWTQTLGEDAYPVPFTNHSKVYSVGTLNCDGSIDPEAIAYSNEEGSAIQREHEMEDGVCVNCGHADPEWMSADEDGWYSIADAKELAWFGAMVNGGNGDFNGRLTDDIDLTGIEWKPIGTEKSPYHGIFDGQQHYVDNLEVNGGNYAGLFGVISDGAEFKNLIVTGVVNGGSYCAGVAAGTNGGGTVKFTNVGNECAVSATGPNAAGIVGVSMGGQCAIILENCYNTGDITGEPNSGSAAFCGWMGRPESKIISCYNTGSVAGCDEGKPLFRYDNIKISALFSTNEDSNQGVVVSKEAVASGELAFLLNDKQAEGKRFFQTLGDDDYPVPFSEGHETVYAQGSLLCDGSVSQDDLEFSNEPGEFTQLDHQYGEDGCCEVCGSAWGISTAEQLLAFSENVRLHLTDQANVCLLNDIDLKDIEWLPIGYGGVDPYGEDDCIPFAGKFDGKGHKIYNMIIDKPEETFLGFFGCITGGAEIRNLIIDKSCYVHGAGFCAGFAGGSKLGGEIIFENCGNEADVLCDGENAVNAAGFLGCCMYSRATFTLTNCFNTGKIEGTSGSASFSGWLGSYPKLTNCWNTGSVKGEQEGENRPFARFDAIQVATMTNCYDLAGTQDGVNRLTASAVTSGELCYKLNEGNTENPIWRQTIGTDPYPAFNPDSYVVYCIDYVYTNDPLRVEPIVSGSDSEATVVGIFTLQGVRTDEMQPGINIVRMSDGTVRKVFVK